MNKSSFNVDIALAVRSNFIRLHDQGLSGKVYNLVPWKTPGGWTLGLEAYYQFEL